MFESVRKFYATVKADACKTRGLAEKEAATQRKIKVAMKILDKRENDVPVDVDRRHHDDEEAQRRWIEFCMRHT